MMTALSVFRETVQIVKILLHSPLDLTALKLPMTSTINHQTRCLLSTSLMFCFVQIKCVNAVMGKNESREILASRFLCSCRVGTFKRYFFLLISFVRSNFRSLFQTITWDIPFECSWPPWLLQCCSAAVLQGASWAEESKWAVIIRN